MGEIDGPILYIGTEYWSVLTPPDEDFHQFFIHAQSPAQEVRVLNSDHVSFIDYIGPFHDFMHLVFGNHPDIDDVMAVADAGETKPPKSTWFEPKLRSGLFVHKFS